MKNLLLVASQLDDTGETRKREDAKKLMSCIGAYERREELEHVKD